MEITYGKFKLTFEKAMYLHYGLILGVVGIGYLTSVYFDQIAILVDIAIIAIAIWQIINVKKLELALQKNIAFLVTGLTALSFLMTIGSDYLAAVAFLTAGQLAYLLFSIEKAKANKEENIQLRMNVNVENIPCD